MELKIRDDVKMSARIRCVALEFFLCAKVGQSVHFADKKAAMSFTAPSFYQRKKGVRADIKLAVCKVGATDPDGIGYRVFVVAA